MSTARENIMAALVAQLQTITVANGYQNNLGLEIHRWPEMAAALPAVVLDDTGGAVVAEPYPFYSHALAVAITIFNSSRYGNSELSGMLADIIKAVGSDNTFGGLALGTTRITAVNKLSPFQRDTGGDAEITLVIDYRTAAWEI